MSRFPFRPKPRPCLVALPMSGHPAWLSSEMPTQARQVPNLPGQANAPEDIVHRIQATRRSLEKTLATNSHIRWIVSSFFLNTWIQAVPRGIASLDELSALVQLRASFLFGQPVCGHHWAVDADWQSSGTMLCHAMPQAALVAFENESVSSLASMAIDALGTIRRNEHSVRWYAVTAANELHILAMQSGTPLTLRSTHRFAGGTADDQIRQTRELWRREQAQSGWHEGNLNWLHCDTNLPLQHLVETDIEWIGSQSSTKAATGSQSAQSDAEQMALAAWALEKMGDTE